VSGARRTRWLAPAVLAGAVLFAAPASAVEAGDTGPATGGFFEFDENPCGFVPVDAGPFVVELRQVGMGREILLRRGEDGREGVQQGAIRRVSNTMVRFVSDAPSTTVDLTVDGDRLISPPFLFGVEEGTFTSPISPRPADGICRQEFFVSLALPPGFLAWLTAAPTVSKEEAVDPLAPARADPPGAAPAAETVAETAESGQSSDENSDRVKDRLVVGGLLLAVAGGLGAAHVSRTRREVSAPSSH
jgi:hypothetical protein